MSLGNSSVARVMRPLAIVVVVLLEMLAASTGALAMDSSNASQKHVVVTTTQSGGGQSGASITVGLGVPVTDQATLTKVKGQGDDVEDEDDDGEAAIAYEVFSDNSCTTRVFDATPSPNLVVKGTAPRSKAFTSPTGGVFYWIARYSGDKHRAAASSACGDERLTVVAQPRLVVMKHVINNDGGTKAAADFTITVTGGSPAPATFAGSEAGTVVTLNAGAYSVDEATVIGYAKSLSSGCAGTIAVSETKTCTITNDDIARPQLTVIKHVVNDDGGTKVASDFAITVTSNGSASAPFAGSEGGTAVTLNAGSYSVDEATQTGYVKSLSAGCSGTVAVGETRTCTITNDDIPVPTATLTVIKHVVNDNGGTSTAADFAITVTNNGAALAPFAGSESGTTLTLAPGTYSIVEGGPTTYVATLAGSCGGTIAAGDAKTCTITNNDIAPQLTVIKHVVNNDGGSRSAPDFTITVTGTAATPASFAGSERGTTVTLNAGPYSVDEVVVVGYARSLGANCTGVIALAENKTCTVTNDDIPPAPQLTVIKHVVNDNGGTAEAGNWSMTVTNNGTPMAAFAGSELPGTIMTLAPGTYGVTESGGPTGYSATSSTGCSGTIAAGEQKICTVTNDDQPAHLTVIKTVINDNGGNKGAADFSITVTGGAPVPATFPGSASGTDVTLSAGAYSVDEAAVAGYSETGAVGCTGTLALGETRVCTITNDDQAVAVTVATTLSGGGQTGPSIRVAPGVSATDQATLSGVTPSAGGTITYKVYSDSSCATLVFDATPSSNTVVNGTAPASTAFSSSSVGIFYWQAVYSGDLNDPRASSVCSDERLRVAPSDAPVLLVKKHVINDSGGRDATKVASNFMYQPQNANGGGLTQSFPGSETGRLFEFAPGTFYNVVEITDPAPTYAVSYSAECTPTLHAGDVKTCTIPNDDIPPARLTVIKHVINDSGGGDATKVAANFSLQILNANGSGITQSFAGSETGTLLELPRGGAYRVAELTDPAPTYALSFSGDCTGTIQAGDTKTCTVINDDIPPARLTVIKHVVNDNGGTAVAANFSLQLQNANGGGITGSFPGSESGTLIEIPRGAPYSVVEVINRAPAYASTVSADCSGTIAAGDSKTCTVTNDDQPAHLRVIKTVINNNGGTKAPGDFTITVTSAGAALRTFPGSAGGTDVILIAGAYSVDEAAVAGYTKTGEVGCTGARALSETKTCTITNDDNAVPTATLTVIKHVVNDNGGAALAGAWSMTVTNNGTLLPSFAGSETGTAVVLSPGSYSTAESGGPAGYTASLTAGCSGTIAAGDTKTCTITNDDQSAHLTVIKHVVNDNGGTKGAGDFTIIVTGGAPSPGSFAGAESPGTLVTLNAGGFSVDEVDRKSVV